MERFAEAIVDCEQALALNPNYADAWSRKGLALYHLGQYAPALAASTRAVTLNGNDASAWYIKGICLEETGKSEEAEIAYAKSLELEIILDIREERKPHQEIRAGQRMAPGWHGIPALEVIQ